MMDDLKAILTEIRDDVDYEKENDLVGSGVFSSLEIFQCIVAIEQKFEISLPPKEIHPNNFRSMESIWQLIKRYQG